MAILPEGFALPPLPYLVALVVAAAVVGYALRERQPPVTEDVALAFTPWMLAGAWHHVLYAVGAAPAFVSPLLGTPSVYVTVAIVAGGVWALADTLDVPVPKTVAAVGSVAALLPLSQAVAYGLGPGRFTPFWPLVALVGGAIVGLTWWDLLRQWRPDVERAGKVGALALVGHAIDGVSTAVGVDVLGFGERTPLSRLIIEFGHSLPVSEFVGAGWLFVLVKLLVAGLVVWLLGDYVREDAEEGRLLLLFVTGVGLGPGAHNLLLFTITG